MRAKIGIALGLYWGGVAQAVAVMAAVNTLGALGGVPAVLEVLTKYGRIATTRLRGSQSGSGASPVSRSVQ
jgi:hypothetical protein